MALQDLWIPPGEPGKGAQTPHWGEAHAAAGVAHLEHHSSTVAQTLTLASEWDSKHARKCEERRGVEWGWSCCWRRSCKTSRKAARRSSTRLHCPPGWVLSVRLWAALLPHGIQAELASRLQPSWCYDQCITSFEESSVFEPGRRFSEPGLHLFYLLFLVKRPLKGAGHYLFYCPSSLQPGVRKQSTFHRHKSSSEGLLAPGF